MMRLLSRPAGQNSSVKKPDVGRQAKSKASATIGMGVLTLALAAVILPARAQAPGKHVHGEATLDIAIEADAITLMLVSPLDNVLGFEHTPQTEAQRERLTAAKRLLASGDTLFTLDPSAGCTTAEIEARLFDEPVTHEAKPNAGESHPREHAHNHGHNDSHKHDNHTHNHNHEQHTGHTAHNDAELTVGFACTAATTAGYIDASPLFNALPRLQKLQVQIAGPGRQSGMTVLRDNGRIPLKN